MSNSQTGDAIVVIGGGLAGTEAAYQLAERGHRVQMREMKPEKRTPAQTGDGLAELVCSNSLRGANISNAVGLLKEELRRCGSLIMRCALESRVPAGGALAVDREVFSHTVTNAIKNHPNIEFVTEEVAALPDNRPVIVATGPLTSDELAADLARLVGEEHLAYYDAIAPIVDAESIDMDIAWKQSRYDKGGADYVNCPLNKEQYQAFVAALIASEKVEPREFEKIRYFEGCLPVEVMAERGEQTLAFGPLKPVGLTDPRTGRRPHGVVQLRPEDQALSAYNLVGFQSRMKWPEQKRVFRMIPGLQNATFMRYGAVHRNTFLNSPVLLDERMQLKAAPGVFIAGQLGGVEGYVESCASGFLCAVLLHQALAKLPLTPPPKTTALGGLLTQLSRSHPKLTYQPSNITWSHIAPLEGPRIRKKHERYAAAAARAIADLDGFLKSIGSPEPSGPKYLREDGSPGFDDPPEVA